MQIYELIQKPRACSYIPQEKALFHYLFIEKCTYEFYEKLLQRGWRRFGKYFFVPICEKCDSCISIRQDCENFSFSKSQKRILKHPFSVGIGKPTITDRHLELYRQYHQKMNNKKGWEYEGISLDAYYDTFVSGHEEFGLEFDYYIDGLLVGVALVDVLPDSISAVYCYYDHDYAKYSIGTYSILKQIEIAKEYNIKYLYPGYWIKNHLSMGYKEKFRPFEILLNRPTLDEKPLWVKE